MAENVGTVDTSDIDDITCYLTRLDDGWHIEYLDETIGDVLPITKDGVCIALPKDNPANRKWFNLKNAEKQFAESGKIGLAYKESKHIGPRTVKIPNETLVKTYLSQEEQDEYFAIMARAQAAYEADHPKKEPKANKPKVAASTVKLVEELRAAGASADDIVAAILGGNDNG